MNPSEFNGRRVLHIDGGGVQHSGLIVGETDDGESVYVQSDNPIAPLAEWHFTVSKSVLPALIDNAETLDPA